MPLTLPLVWSDDCLLHEPGGELWIGLPSEGEGPERALAIRDALVGAGARIVEAEPHGDTTLLAVHDEAFVSYLRDAWRLWDEAGYPEEHGQIRVVPYLFLHPGLLAGQDATPPATMAARAGLHAFDTMSPIGSGTWPAARAAIDVALTAADLVADGARLAYACTRPPGHHVTRDAFGGSCYLNNSAVAAERLHERGFAKVAILDVDAHQGNGAQAIFWERDDVLTASVHVDPRAGWFPHFFGFETENRETNLNVPLEPGAGDGEWVAGVEHIVEWARAAGADAAVVALGVDAAEGDPAAPLRVTADGFREGGRVLGALSLPTVLVQEGGYDLDALGSLVLAALEGVEEGARVGDDGA